MRQKIAFSLIALLGIGTLAQAQDSGLRGVYGAGNSAISSGAPGIGQSARPASGIYGAGASAIQPAGSGIGLATPQRPLSGIYGPGESASPAPLAGVSSGNGAATVQTGPNVSINGFANVGSALPFGTNSTPLDDRPGYGVAIVNGRRAIIDRSTNRIYQYEE